MQQFRPGRCLRSSWARCRLLSRIFRPARRRPVAAPPLAAGSPGSSVLEQAATHAPELARVSAIGDAWGRQFSSTPAEDRPRLNHKGRSRIHPTGQQRAPGALLEAPGIPRRGRPVPAGSPGCRHTPPRRGARSRRCRRPSRTRAGARSGRDTPRRSGRETERPSTSARFSSRASGPKRSTVPPVLSGVSTSRYRTRSPLASSTVSPSMTRRTTASRGPHSNGSVEHAAAHERRAARTKRIFGMESARPRPSPSCVRYLCRPFVDTASRRRSWKSVACASRLPLPGGGWMVTRAYGAFGVRGCSLEEWQPWFSQRVLLTGGRRRRSRRRRPRRVARALAALAPAAHSPPRAARPEEP